MPTKTCTKCQISKELIDFGTRKRNSDGKRPVCKECEKIERKAYLNTPAGIDKRKSSWKKWYALNRDRQIKNHLVWCEDNKEKRSIAVRRFLLSKYNLTPDQYETMLIEQNHKCKICGSPKPGNSKRFFYIDHCHKTNLVRGLLCARCNLAIGQFKDEVSIIIKAAAYVQYGGTI